MDFAVTYLAQRFFYRIFEFFHHWYFDGSRQIGRRFMGAITVADQSFAVNVTLRHFFEPLYKDYSVVGRILGIIFRSFRVALGGAIYVVIALVFAAVYLIWLAIPAAILYYAARNI